MITCCCSREQSDAAVGSAREQPGLSGVKLAGKYSKVGHHVMAAQNFHRDDQRVFVEVAARKNKTHSDSCMVLATLRGSDVTTHAEKIRHR